LPAHGVPVVNRGFAPENFTTYDGFRKAGMPE